MNLVEETEPVKKDVMIHAGSTKHDNKTMEVSHTTIALAVWRCSECRALACGQRGSQAPQRCGKCGR